MDGFVAERVFPSVIKICIDVSAAPLESPIRFSNFPLYEDLRATPARPVNSRRGEDDGKEWSNLGYPYTPDIVAAILRRDSCLVTD